MGPASRTVAGATVPSSRNSCVMPTFLPMIPFTILFRPQASGPGPVRRRHGSRRPQFITFYALDLAMPVAPAPCPGRGRKPLLVILAERLDLDVHTRGQIQLHQRIHRLRRRLEDVDQPLVRPDLELLA